MNFLKPTSLYLLLLIPLLLLLYMFRLKRKTHVVSSCLLWEQAIEDMKANTPFQRLRRNLLLPLQIVFLTLAVFAAARPFWRGTANIAQNIIVIIDGSASMKATDAGESRFKTAKSAAANMVDDLSDGDRMMIIEAASSHRIVSGFTSDKLHLRNALGEMQPADTSTDLGGAIQLASSIAKDTQGSEIFLLSDGAGMVTLPRASKGGLERVSARVNFIGVGRKDAENVGITDLEVGHSPADLSERQVFVALQNFSDTERRPVLLELYHSRVAESSFENPRVRGDQSKGENGGVRPRCEEFGNENLIDVRELSLSPGERRSIIFDGLAGNVEGYVKAVIDIDDDLDVDNRAYYILSEPSALQALLVSRGNLFLEKAIRTASTRIELFSVEPEAYSAAEKAGSLDREYDVFIFDGFTPSDPISESVMFVNPETDLPFGKSLFYNDNPTVIDWDRSHPVMRFLDLSNLQVDRSRNYEMPPWMKPLVESDMGTLVWLGERDGQRIIVLPFEIRPRSSSNFPVLPAFPIFVSNALNWLAGAEGGASRRQVRPGEPLKLYFPRAADAETNGSALLLTVRKPDGKAAKLRPKDGNLVFNDTDMVGVYEVTGGGVSEEYAVNLLDESESDIKPLDRIKIAGQEIVSSSISAVSNREIWAGLVLAALMLLAAEWWVYHRRVSV